MTHPHAAFERPLKEAPLADQKGRIRDGHSIRSARASRAARSTVEPLT
jgi:hypothetical protein